MAHSNLHHVTEVELAGRWVAVHGSDGNGGDGSSLPAGAVIVDYDTELDLLCQRVAAAGQSGLTIYRYSGRDSDGYSGGRSSRYASEHTDFLSRQGQYLPGHLPGSRGRA